MTELKTVQPKDASRPRRSWLVPPWSLGSPSWSDWPSCRRGTEDRRHPRRWPMPTWRRARTSIGSNHRPVRLRRHGVGG